jgi:hypothetical protein
MTSSKSKKAIKQMKFFYSRAKFRAFTDAMLANDEKEWKIFKSRNEDFFKANVKFNRSSLAELMLNKSFNPTIFCDFMIVNNMEATFKDDIRIDENEKVIYSVQDNLFTLGERYNRKFLYYLTY